MGLRKDVVIKDAPASKPVLMGWWTNCENLPSSRYQPDDQDENEVDKEQLQGDCSLRQAYNSELVEAIDGDETTSTSYEENLSEDDLLSLHCVCVCM